MVSKKRLHYGGFDGFNSPVVPKAPRSIRKNSPKKSSPDSEICAFELLAAVAGKLLQESEGSASSISPEHKEQINILKDNVKQESLEVKLKSPKLDDLDHGCCAESQFVPEPSNLKLKDSLHSDNDSGLEHASIVTTDFLKESITNVKLEDGTNIIPKLTETQSEDLKDTVKKHRVLSKSYSNVHLPFYNNPVPSASFLKHRGKNVKIGLRDNDENENSFTYNHYTNKMKTFRFQSRCGYRRIRKILSSKYWKTSPKLKDHEVNNITSGVFKKRKLFHHSSKPEYVEETSSESISNSPERHSSKRVKFSIKSFKVPELYLEMPETSTVGSLKRNVMEALTAILGGELHIGVLLHGKKVRDDNITLQQTGVILNSDTFGFILEPNLPEPSESLPSMSPQSDTHQPLSTCLESPNTEAGFSNCSVGPLNVIEKSKEEILVDTKAIVPMTVMNPDAISVVPINHKLMKRSELSQSQRRRRRPFSVSEVEALVEAVETLGTGRWRDVKIRAFDDANHRTYVDLKDKWKTLVHTASISPQQRRGEPVPQNLLDRVLAAHAFWTQNQSKQHGKHLTEPVQTVGTAVTV